MIEFQNVNAPATEAEIQIVELAIGTALPEEYRKHILRFNGGRPVGDLTFDVTTRFGTSQEAPLWFYEIGSMATNSLLSAYEAFRERLPEDLISIAGSRCGGELLLGLKGEQRGKIFYFDLEDEPSEHEDPLQCFYPLADSLADFFAMMYEYKDKDE